MTGLARVRIAAAGLALAAAGCHESSPTAPDTRHVLVLSYTAPCARGDALVTLDGAAVGRVPIPGSFSVPLAAGGHRLQVGSGPETAVEMPEDRDLVLTNAPVPCP